MNITLKVEGMSCQHCVNSVKKEFEKAGLTNHSIEIGQVKIKFETDNVDLNLIKELIEKAGYKVLDVKS
jgi:copper chaperone